MDGFHGNLQRALIELIHILEHVHGLILHCEMNNKLSAGLSFDWRQPKLSRNRATRWGCKEAPGRLGDRGRGGYGSELMGTTAM